MDTDFISISDIARLLNVSRQTILDQLKGKINAQEIVVKTEGQNSGSCPEGEKVTRQFFVYSEGDFFNATVEVYFG